MVRKKNNEKSEKNTNLKKYISNNSDLEEFFNKIYKRHVDDAKSTLHKLPFKEVSDIKTKSKYSKYKQNKTIQMNNHEYILKILKSENYEKTKTKIYDLDCIEINIENMLLSRPDLAILNNLYSSGYIGLSPLQKISKGDINPKSELRPKRIYIRYKEQFKEYLTSSPLSLLPQ